MAFHEVIPEGEAEMHDGYAAEIKALQQRQRGTDGVARALHNKQHIGVVGVLEVKAADGGREGLFAEQRSFPLYARFSNASSRKQSDKVDDVRGFALKLVGVPGRKLIPGLEQELTQDFLFIQNPAIPFRDPAEFMTFVRAAKDGPAKLLPRLLSGFGLRRGLQIVARAVKSAKVKSFASQDFHTAAPIAFGAAAAKLGLFPSQRSPSQVDGPAEGRLGRDLTARLRASSLSWTLKAQLFADDQSTPIEDASVTWSGPWIELGMLTLPRQDPESAKGREISELVSRLSFDPWHAVEAHRPLGAIMRARAVAYRESVLGRNAAPEPKSVIALD